jgi:ATP-dependent Clp protease ATP-binding subunit ClpC
MFERFDEPARRALFFARYEASLLGSRAIESEHLLLGLIREPKSIAARILGALPLSDLRKELESRRTDSKVGTDVEIPFSAPTKRALGYAAEEADRLAHRHIGPEHLLLGLLRDEDSVAASMLARYGLRRDGVLEQVQALSSAPPSSVVSNVAAREQIQRISEAANELSSLLSSNQEAAMRVGLLLMDLQALKSFLADQR